MIDHISLGVSDLERSKRFYDAVLAPLGIVPCRDTPRSRDYALNGSDDFGIQAMDGRPATPSPQNHYAFAAPSRDAVDRFHAAAVERGGRDDGPPGLRPEYHAGYYAAFVLDPDGHRIEAVFHDRREERP
jgi:catechol 2,3-dioxygenase-like lactoylglutathione lyase family enzyme